MRVGVISEATLKLEVRDASARRALLQEFGREMARNNDWPRARLYLTTEWTTSRTLCLITVQHLRSCMGERPSCLKTCTLS